MKKVISMLLALTLVLGMGTAAFAESEPVLETGVVESEIRLCCDTCICVCQRIFIGVQTFFQKFLRIRSVG